MKKQIKRSDIICLFDNFKSVRIRLENVKTFIKRKIQTRQIVEFGFLVRVTGLEPARIAPMGPKGHATSVISHKPNRIKGFRVLPFLIFA